MKSLLTALLFLPSPLWAHAFLDEATPKVGATVATAPPEITILFTQGVEPAFSTIALAGPNGQPVKLGPVGLDPADRQRLRAPLVAPLPPGHYEVRWSVISVDTHHTDGHYSFDYAP